ncbi:MAG TPA: glycoside hydrolase family 3 C-terminal domain-containing protein [Abditibacterium sp.]|jgi:beta-glucosidase
MQNLLSSKTAQKVLLFSAVCAVTAAHAQVMPPSGPSSSQTTIQLSTPIYLDTTKPLETRVEDLLSRMTLEEKVSLLHGDSKFTTNAIPRLGIPRRWMSDGPHGVREDIGPDTWNSAGRTDDFATYMPSLINLASTWNPELSRAYGTVIGEEARARGKDIMLGPGFNILRTPLNGRNWEYLGEDPLLASRMAVPYVQAVQAQGVAACVKHYALNNQETQRGSINVEIDERALREIYLPAFKATTQEGGAWAVMAAYNRVRGAYSAENDYLNNVILKGQWGFKGLVMSDWSGTHTTKGAALGGLDLEMGSNGAYDDFYLAKPFREGIKSGVYPMALLDDKVRRNLRVMIATNALNPTLRPAGKLNTQAHQDTARRISEEGIVLLKNQNNALPLDASKLQTIAVIGENATLKHGYGGDSARIKAFYEVTPLEGMIRRAGTGVNITYSQGYKQPARRARGAADAAGVQDYESSPAGIAETAALVERAVKAASQADVAVVFGGLNHARNLDTEGADRRDIKLPYGQDELIRRVVAANPRTIVVLVSGGPVEMGPWLQSAPAVVAKWYSGMEGGNAITNVLFGDVNPSGKLPCTFPVRLSDSPAHATNDPKMYPGVDGVVNYSEGMLVGYRWFDSKAIAPLFPFGYGLSYSTFAYSNLKITPNTTPNGPLATATFDIQNTSARDGSEVAQLYIGDPQSSLPRPPQELKGFSKVALRAGETKTVSIPLDRTAFSFYHPTRKGWLAEAGTFNIAVGSSSRDLKLKGAFRLARPIFVAE